MKYIHLLLFSALTTLLHGEIPALVTLEYRLHQSTYIKLNKLWGDDPFAPKEKKELKEGSSLLPEDSLEALVARALEIEITESNGKYLLYDGESIYARITKPEHKKLESAIETKGIEVSTERESKALELLTKKKERPNKTH